MNGAISDAHPRKRVAPSANFTVSSKGATSAKRSSIFLEGLSCGVMENDSHRVPTARSDATDSGQMRVKRGPKRFDRLGERIRPILVFAAAESMLRHHDATAGMLI